MVAADKPALEPRNCSNAGAKSELDRPCRYSNGNTSASCGDFRDQAGRIAEENRLPFTGRLIDAPVVDPRLPDRHRPRRRGHLPRCVEAVADHQPVTIGVHQILVRLDMGGHLGQQRRRQHLLGAVATNLIQQRPADRLGVSRVLNYLEHGRTFPNQRANAGPDQSYLDFRSSSGRCVRSRHPAEGHPVGWPGGFSPPGSHRTVRDSLPSHGSYHPVGRKSRVQAHWANPRG